MRAVSEGSIDANVQTRPMMQVLMLRPHWMQWCACFLKCTQQTSDEIYIRKHRPFACLPGAHIVNLRSSGSQDKVT